MGASTIPDLGEATVLVADKMREQLREIVESVTEATSEPALERGFSWNFDVAFAAALVAADVAFDEAVSIGHWALRGQGGTDYCREWGEEEDLERVIDRAVEHGLLVVRGAAFVGAMMALQAQPATGDES